MKPVNSFILFQLSYTTFDLILVEGGQY